MPTIVIGRSYFGARAALAAVIRALGSVTIVPEAARATPVAMERKERLCWSPGHHAGNQPWYRNFARKGKAARY